MDHISANSLRGHLSFLASDRLEGRGTPSRGLDLAAEYIAAQFRRAGLEAAGDDGYYQTAEMLDVEPAESGFEMKIEQDGRIVSVRAQEITPRFRTPLELSGVALYKVDGNDEKGLRNLKPEDVQDKVIVAELPDFTGAAASDSIRKFRLMMRAIEDAEPRLTLLLARNGIAELNTRLVPPEEEAYGGPPRMIVRSSEALRWCAALRPGASGAWLTLRLPEPKETHVKLHNVIGLLRGSDPILEKTYLLVTAHYDHLGTHTVGTVDEIFHGANDDGSGTVSVIELAAALGTLKPRPRRSIVFMTFFGEEEGLLGSRAYVKEHFADRQTMQLKGDHAKLSAYFNIDNGTGKIRGIYLQGDEAARPVFEKWMEPFKGMGMTTLSIRSVGSTDHVSFDEVGLPGFQFIQDPVEYETRTHHTNMDVYERVQEADVKQMAVIAASFAYLAANADEQIPRKPLPKH